MEQLSHITLKDSAELLKFRYPDVKGLLEYARIEGKKQGSCWVYPKKDIESLSVKLKKIIFGNQDDSEHEKYFSEIAGYFKLEDGTEKEVKKCPFCGSKELQWIGKKVPNGRRYAFIKCKACSSSSGSSNARESKLFAICQREAIEKWNRRDE